MRDETDNNTINLFGDAEPRSATQQVTSLLPIDIEQPAQPDEQKARAHVNSVSVDALQDQAKIHALKFASKAIKLGYKHKALFCYTDAAGQPMYFKVRHEYPNFESLSADEQQRIATLAKANNHKWIRALSLNHDSQQWQLKAPDFKTVYPAGNGKKPLYRLLDIVQAEPSQAVYLFEGEQKADYAASIELLATTCGGSNDIAATDLEPLTGRFIVIWADNDEPGIKARNELIEALHAINCKVSYIDVAALGLPEKGDIIDWAELRGQDGLDATKADIEALPIVHCEPPQCQVLSGSSDEALQAKLLGLIPKGQLCEPMAYGGNDARFEVLPNGIFYIAKDQHDNERSHFISSPILVIAKTRDGTGNAWGRLLQWHDDEGRLHQWAMPMNLLKGDGSDIRGELFDQGVMISPEKKSRDLLSVYLGSYPIDKFALCVDRLGWHGLRYVMPQQTYGEQNEQLTVFQQTSSVATCFYQIGTLAEWQQHISAPSADHSRLVFSISVAFAGQLLEPLNEQSGGFHIRGNSSSGKSTALKIAGSVWGNSQQVIRQWRATSNALEGIAAMHNDGFLGLDEISQCDPKDVGNTIYMLSNGQGKARMQRTGATKPVTQWRVLFLSNGEKSLDSIMGQIGKRTNAGQEIRLADIPADAGHNLGIFDPLPRGQRPADYAEQLQQAAANYYGSAGIAWLEYLTNDKAAATEQAKLLIQQFMQHYANDKSGQVQRVAKRFALVAAAGELAIQAGITGWQQGRAIEAVGQCFNDWLSGFGDGANLEERAILIDVKSFFQANGSSRFENINPPIMASGDDMPQRINNRVGYFRQDGEGKTYLVYPEQFKTEVCQGHDTKQVAKILLEAGWLELGDGGRDKKRESLPDGTRPRLYVFNSKMWEWDSDSDQSQNSPNNSGTAWDNGTDLVAQGIQPVPEVKTTLGQRGTVGQERSKTEQCPKLSQSVPVPINTVGQHESIGTKSLSQMSQLSHENKPSPNPTSTKVTL